MKKTACMALFVILFARSSFAQNRSIHFSGHVSKGEKLQKELTRDLLFVLLPREIAPGAIGGWTITVSPRGDHPSGCDDFVWVVMPPYRSYNPRYLDTSYGTTAKEAVSFSPRDFSFVLNCSDYKREEEWVTRLLWSYNYSEAQVKEAESRLGSSVQGKGSLTIRDYQISPAPKLVEGKNLGQIDWIDLEVEIEIP